MTIKYKLATVAASIMFASSAFAAQATIDAISEFNFTYKQIENNPAKHGENCQILGADWAACSVSSISLTNNTGNDVSDADWAIYYHNIRRTLAVDNPEFKVTFITGDLHKIEPTDVFTGFKNGETKEIKLIDEYWKIFQTDVLPNWYVTSSSGSPKIIKDTAKDNSASFVTGFENQWERTPADNNVYMLPDTRFEKNSDITNLDTSLLHGSIVPTPVKIDIKPEIIDLSSGISLNSNNAALDSASIASLYANFERFGIPVNGRYSIDIHVDPVSFVGTDADTKSGSYILETTTKGAKAVGYDRVGAIYAVQSIINMLNDKQISSVSVFDYPRFDYRGFMIDVGRNFHSKKAVKRAIEQMSAYKLNKLHFHLTDDEGWRIEIPGLPELTEVGSKRCHDLTEQSCLLPQLGSGPASDNMGSGHLTKADYIEIVKYARSLGVEIIPEIDMPAHMRAAIQSMEARFTKTGDATYRLIDPADTSRTTSVQFYDKHSYLNPCIPSSIAFVDKVITEIAGMHKEAGQPLAVWHFGGDEAKNIRLGGGYADKKDSEAKPWQGLIDKSIEDKPWAKSEACKTLVNEGKVDSFDSLPSYFAIQVSNIVKKHDINTMQTWQDGLKGQGGFINAADFAVDNVNVNLWETVFWGAPDVAADLQEKGYNVVLSNPDFLYFDFPYEVNVQESGYYWGTRYSDERRVFAFTPNLAQNAEIAADRDGNAYEAKFTKSYRMPLGMSMQAWSEIIRTDDQLEYMIFPRLVAGAERAWHQGEWENAPEPNKVYKMGETNNVDKAALHADFVKFANIIGKRELRKIEAAGVRYRLPVPGAKIIDGKLNANIVFPGLAIEYSADNGNSWEVYNDSNKPDVVSGALVRSKSYDGLRYSRVEIVK